MGTRRYLGVQVAAVLVASVLIALALWAMGPPPPEAVGQARPALDETADGDVAVAVEGRRVGSDAERRTSSSNAEGARRLAPGGGPRGVSTAAAHRSRLDRGRLDVGRDRDRGAPEVDLADRGDEDLPIDLVGFPPGFLRAFHDELVPQYEDCIAQLGDRVDEPGGTAGLLMSVRGDAVEGTVVETVAPHEGAEEDGLERTLLECLESAAWTMELPALPDGEAHDLIMFMGLDETVE